MREFATLFTYEVKKISQSKSTWVPFFLLVVLFIFIQCSFSMGAVYLEGEFLETHAQREKIERKNGLKLSGRKIDDRLLNEYKTAYAKVAGKEPTEYLRSEVYQKEVRPYSGVDSIIQGITGIALNEVTEDTLYRARSAAVDYKREHSGISQEEKAYWLKQEEKLKTPFTYQYAQSWIYLISMEGVYRICLLVSFFIAVSMSGVFFNEHSQKTDQLLLCSRFGRTRLYRAKIVAGIFVTLVVTLILYGISLAGAFFMWGADGFQAAIQLFMGDYSGNLSVGQTFIAMSVILILSCVLTAVFTMVLSELLRSNIGAMAVVLVMLFASRLVQIPAELRIISQFWSFLPLNILKLDFGFTDYRLISFGNVHLTGWQFVPFFYLFLLVLVICLGEKVYCRFQVQGR